MARLKVPRDLRKVLINHAPPVPNEICDRDDQPAEKRDPLERNEQFLQTVFAQGPT